MIHHKVDQNTLEWLQLRLGIPTASVFDKILTPAKRQRSAQAEHLMDRLIFEWMTGEAAEDEARRATEWMQRGIEEEDAAIAAYEFDADAQTEPGGFFTIDSGLAGASPDRLVGKEGLLEIKCPLGPTQVGAWRRGVEVDHLCQIQGQLWIAEREWVDLFSYHPKLPLTAKRVYRDEEFIKDLALAVHDFIEQMLRVRADAEREKGPFLRKGTEPPPEVDLIANPTIIRESDLDEILRLRRSADEALQRLRKG